MSKVLYEYEGFKLVTTNIIIITVVILLIIAGAIVYTIMNKKKASSGLTSLSSRMVYLFGLFLLIWIWLPGIAQSDLGNLSNQIMENNQYKWVEGYVENFDPMPVNGKGYESFDIDGVFFKYADAISVQGYNNGRVEGGVITGDGQHLRIGYYTAEEYDDTLGEYGNVILYIEEID